MISLFLLFSHRLTQDQIDEAKKVYGIRNFIYLPQKLQKKWSQVSPQGEVSINYLEDIKKFIMKNLNKKNYALIQGEYGLTYSMIDWCFENHIIPIYATSRRIYKEEILENGEIRRIHIFKHVNFRKYHK